jgi:hypothetical protein
MPVRVKKTRSNDETEQLCDSQTRENALEPDPVRLKQPDRPIRLSHIYRERMIRSECGAI